MTKPIFRAFILNVLLLSVPCSVPAAIRIQGNRYSTPPMQVTPDVTTTFKIRSLTTAEQEGNGHVPGAAKIVSGVIIGLTFYSPLSGEFEQNKPVQAGEMEEAPL